MSNESSQKRDSIRAAILGLKPRSKTISVAGVTIELRQPPIGEVLAGESTKRVDVISKMLTDYCYVPGTDEKVFDAADVEGILALPFNGEYNKLQAAISELTNLDSVIESEGND